MGKQKQRVSEQHLFTRRTQVMYLNQRDRAKEAHAELDYDLAGLRDLVQAFLGSKCFWCEELLTAKNFSVDHKTPVSRQGSYGVHNLAVYCRRCNETKGNMTAAEFTHLHEAIHTFGPEARRSLLARLRAGGKVVRG